MRSADARPEIDQRPDDRGRPNQPEQCPTEAERDQSEYGNEQDYERDRDRKHEQVDDEGDRAPHQDTAKQLRLEQGVERMLITGCGRRAPAVAGIARTAICHDPVSRPLVHDMGGTLAVASPLAPKPSAATLFAARRYQGMPA